MDFQQTVINKYRLPEEVNFYSQQAEAGLTPYEEKMLVNFLPQKAEILDLGCGAGREAFPLARLGHKVTAVDICPELIKAGKKWAAKLKLPVDFRLIAAGEQLPFPQEMFDAAVLLSQFMGHIQGMANRIDYLAQIRRVLAPEGLIFLSVHDRSTSGKEEWNGVQIPAQKGGEPGDIWIDQISDHPTPGDMYFHLFHRDEILAELTDAGFEILEWWNIIDPPEDQGEPTVWDKFIYIVGKK